MGIRRKKICMPLLIIVLIFMSACTAETQSIETSQPNTRDPISMRITWTDYSGRGVAIQKIIDQYNRENENTADIILQSGDEDLKTIEALLSSDTAPIVVLPYRYVKYLGDKGLLTDLTVSFREDAALFYPQLWDMGKANGKSYGIPWLGHSICLIYNKTLLQKAGVDPEHITSLDNLVVALEQVEAKTTAKGIGLVGKNHNDLSWMVNQFVYGFGAQLVDDTGTKVMINSEQAKEAILFYKDVLGKHAQPTWLNDTGVDVMNSFRKQEIAFEFQGVWGITDIEKNDKPFEVGLIKLNDIGLKAEVGPMMLAIPANLSDEKRADAEEFIRYMISIPAQERIMDGEYSPEHDAYYPFRVPVRKDLGTSFIFQQYPQYWPFVEGFESPSIDVPVPKWQTIKDDYYAPGLSRIMSGELTIETFLQDIEQKGNVLLGK